MKATFILCAGLAVVVSGCVSTNITPISQNEIIVSTSAAPVCGRAGAQRVALQQVAVETIRRGFDTFIIAGAASQNDVRVVGFTPITSSTDFSAYYLGPSLYGNANTVTQGGAPIIGGSYYQDFAVVMYRYADPLSRKAIDARAELGPEWRSLVPEDQLSCF